MLSSLFRPQSSKACMFLAAVRSGSNGTVDLQWEMKHTFEKNAFLAEDSTHIVVNTTGFYFVFVHVTYKMNPSGITKCSCSDLILTVTHGYKEGLRHHSAVYMTHCEAPKCCTQADPGTDVDIILSQPTLLRMESLDNLTVSASYSERLDYEQNPTGTFLTLLKYSD